MECKLKCINFRRVLDLRRAVLQAFRVTGNSNHCERSTMGVGVNGGDHMEAPDRTLGPPGWTGDKARSTKDNLGSTWEHQGQVAKHQ
jgi:hypothetical protein